MKDFASKHPDLQELLNQLSNYFPEILKYEKTITMLLPFAIQLSLVLIIILIAQAFSKVTDNYLTNHKKYLLKYLANLNTFTYALGLLVVLSAFLKYITFESALVDASILILAIRALPNMVNHTKLRESTKKRFVFIGWVLLVLMLTKSITPIIDFLDTAQFTVGEKVISVWSIVKAVIIFVLLIWAVGKMTSLIEKNFLRNNRKLSPSARTLIVKITNISGLIIAFMMTLDIIGIDLAAFAFFGGALGIGIGFGLQKVVGNLISGMILIMDKSIKPGDVITVADTYGEVTALHARYVVVRKRNGTEVLIPNEHLMTNEVINWSYENKNVRITVEVGVSYDSDIEHVQAILHEVTKNSPRVLNEPEPRAFLTGFGDSSINFEVRFWVNDPEAGIGAVRSEIFMEIWKRFKEENIEIPFPQRVVHLPEKKEEKRSTLTIPVVEEKMDS
ncbi:MAG: mechanosensitive ion channel protein MscS [Magnetococcales bacterium]|nr:mechanosensitive ion channel protein MscS [Magnetococcales bacterium]|tara:strand:+ start:70501 stop:71841 length:1341 start_codon:yes stop_codon:yes gene_type:complete